jgi:soluble lytic murein transglycosylase-like protein
MRLLIVVLAVLAAVVSPAPAAHASDMTSAEFFARDRANDWRTPSPSLTPHSPSLALPSALPAKKQAVAAAVARQASKKLGSQWAQTAVRLAKIESSFNCNAAGPRVRSHGGDRALGPMQVMPRTARSMGFEPSRLRECEYGIAAGVEHMRRCIETGVRTHVQMSSCYVSGLAGWKKRLHPGAERYRAEYIRLASR